MFDETLRGADVSRAIPPIRAPDGIRLLHRAGSGGFGEVWEGLDGDQRAAIKFFRTTSEVVLEEALLLETLAHPGVVSVRRHGITDGVAWMSMAWVQGVPLHQRWAAIPLGQALGALATLCATLAWLHGEGVLHLDVKPQNVLIGDGSLGEGSPPILVDFGLGRRRLGRDSLRDRSAIGTQGYLAPERALGRPGDARSDLYAVGAMLRALSHQRGDLPAGIEALAKALLSPNPRERPRDALAIAEGLLSLGADPIPQGWPVPRPTLHRPPLCGREAPIAALYRATSDGQTGRVIAISGPAGCGKTRIAAEVADMLEEHRIILQPRHAPLSSPPGALEQLRTALADEGLSTSAFDGDGASFEGRLERWEHAVWALAARKPLLWILEDADTLDAFTRAWLEQLSLSLSLRPVPFIALLLCRDTPIRGADLRVELDALSPDASLSVVRGALSDDQFEGAPYRATPAAALSWVRAAVDAGALRDAKGRFTLHAPLDDDPCALLQSLPERCRAALTVAAILGPDATLVRVAQLTDARAVQQALARGVLQREVSRIVADEALARALLDAMDPATRARWHAEAARCLIADGAAPGTIAAHLAAANDPDAARYWAAAGHLADLSGDMSQFVVLLSRAVEGMAPGALRGRAATDLGIAAIEVQQSDLAMWALQIGMKESVPGDDRARVTYAGALAAAGDVPGARALLLPLVLAGNADAMLIAARIARDGGDLDEAERLFCLAGREPGALGGRAALARHKGELDRAQELLDSALRCCDATTPARIVLDLRLKQATLRATRDSMDGVAAFTELFLLAESRAHPSISWPAAVNLGIALAEAGWPEQASCALRWAAVRFARQQHRGHLALIAASLASVELSQGRPDAVARWCDLADALTGQRRPVTVFARLLAAAHQRDLVSVRALSLRCAASPSAEARWLLDAASALQQGPDAICAVLARPLPASVWCGHLASLSAILFPELSLCAIDWWRSQRPSPRAQHALAALGVSTGPTQPPPALPPAFADAPPVEEILAQLERLAPIEAAGS